MTRRPHDKIEAAFDVQQGVWALDAFSPAQGHEQAWFREISIAPWIINVMILDTYETKSAMRLVSLPSQCFPFPDPGMPKLS
jgi:hypothetical protein